MVTGSRHKERDYLDVYQEVTRLISMIRDPQLVMELVVERLPVLLEVDAATIRLFDESTNSFVLGAAHGLSQEYLSRQTIDTSEVMEELRQGNPTARSKVSIPRDRNGSDSVQKEGVKSALSLPILYREKVIGILRLLTRVQRDFTEAEAKFAMSLAEQVGIAIVNSNLFQEQENQLKFFQELKTISQLVNSTLDLDQILKSIVDKLPPIMGVKGCTIRLVDPATNRLDLVAASGLSEKYLARGSIRKEDSIFKALKGEPVAIYDATTDPRVNYHKEIASEGIKSILAIPIRNEMDVIGVMRLLTSEHHTFTQSEINFAVAAAEESGSAIQKARTYRQITLLFNQIEENERFLQTILDSLWLSLLVVDRDKRVMVANKNLLDLHNLSESEILGLNYDKITPWLASDPHCTIIDQVLSSNASVAVLDKLETDQGTSWYERHLTPIVNDRGSAEFVIEAVRDITDQKLLEQEKMERMKLQGVIEMAGTAAHQLNSPLFAALGTAQLMIDDVSDKHHIEDLETIIKNLKTMAELTRKMTEVTGYQSSAYVGDTKIVELKTKDQFEEG